MLWVWSPSVITLFIQGLISNVEKRIKISSLYLGTGELEGKLVRDVLRMGVADHTHYDIILSGRRSQSSSPGEATPPM